MAVAWLPEAMDASMLRDSPVPLDFLMPYTYSKATISNGLCSCDNRDKLLGDEASLNNNNVVIFNVGVIRMLFASI